MERMTKLISILERLEKLSSSILSKMVPIKKYIIANEQELIDSIRDRTDLLEEVIVQKIQRSLAEYSEPASCFKSEYETFADGVTTNDQDKITSAPFLSEVWYGDYYDGHEEYNALVRLEHDLDNTNKSLTLEFIIDNI
jgi:hypothetical protein